MNIPDFADGDLLNEGRSVSPGDTHPSQHAALSSTVRSTKAGASAPATPGRALLEHRSKRTLNEGRSVSPGDTRREIWTFEVDADAQRRPERQPRRHPPGPCRIPTASTALNEGRSVSPGDTIGTTMPPPDGAVAQRRPERQPRRHACSHSGVIQGEQRSTKAGASAPATPVATAKAMGFSVRSTKAGASAPATPEQEPAVCGPRLHRSTKAGASAPATPVA